MPALSNRWSTVMAHKLGLKVIAEGVETCEQYDALKAMECDDAEGFLISEATPSGRLTEMLQGGVWRGTGERLGNGH